MLQLLDYQLQVPFRPSAVRWRHRLHVRKPRRMAWQRILPMQIGCVITTPEPYAVSSSVEPLRTRRMLLSEMTKIIYCFGYPMCVGFASHASACPLPHAHDAIRWMMHQPMLSHNTDSFSSSSPTSCPGGIALRPLRRI